MTKPRLQIVALLAATILILTGCISTGPSLRDEPKGVTLSGTVRKSVAPTVMSTMSLMNAQAQDEEMPVTVLRVASDGTLEPIAFGTTDDQGRFTVSGIPNQTHVVVQADVTAQSGEQTKSVTLLSTVVTQGNTQVEVDPLHHVAYETIRKYAEISFALWKLVIPPDDLQQIISVTTDIFMSDILPQIGPPPDIATWDESIDCEGIAYGEAPTVPTLECYLDHVDRTIFMSPSLVQRVNDILEPHIPTKDLPLVDAGTIRVDGLSDDWTGIAPITTNRPKHQGTHLSGNEPELKEMHLAGDGEYMNVLVQLNAEGFPTDALSYRLQFFAGAGRWDTSVNITIDLSNWVSASSGDGTALDSALIDWKQHGRFLELRFPARWITDVFGDNPFLVLIHSDAPPHVPCEDGSAGQSDCFAGGWQDVLPVVRVISN